MSGCGRSRQRVLIAAGALTLALAGSGRGDIVRAQSMPLPEPGVCQGCTPPLVYHGGPVLDTSSLTLTPIYWAPAGYSFPQTYTTIINQYLTDVAAASGSSNSTYAIDDEYYQMSGGTKQPVSYNIQAGTPITANDPIPSSSSPCSVNPGYQSCVAQDQIQSELSTVLAANNLPADMQHMYLMMFPPGMQTFEGNARSQDVYCALHSSFSLPNNGGIVLYADEPYITTCSAGQAPNGDAAADTEVSVMSHEVSEAITDPLDSSPSWYDSSGNEIGDECNFNYGPPMGSTDPNNPQTTEYNQVINGHDYYVQTMFSNASFNDNGVGKGCLISAYASSAATASPTAADLPSMATLDLSDTKLPADGSSTTTATLTVLDGSGDPVSGDHVHFNVKPDDDTPGTCGTLSSADGTTDDNGEVETTYTASTENVACIVLGLDAESGASDWGTVYQGSAGDMQPGITDASVPASITPGGAAQTFTVTAANPSSSDVADVRFDVFLTGDDNGANGSLGLTAGEVHLAYSDDTTGGQFLDVTPDGETTKDGEIDAYAMPDKAAQLPAGGSRTVTFRISLDSGAPDSTMTGQPLHIETDVDQFNPADESLDTLDYEGPDDVAVSAPGSSGGFPVWLIVVIVVVVLAAAGAALVATRRRQRPQAG